MKNPAFIVGNGESRRSFDLKTLLDVAPIFGCNALYREFTPDWLVAIDSGMVNEIKTESNFPSDKCLFPKDESEEYELAECHPGRQYRPRNNAGMFAMMKAIDRGHDILICLGFDFIIDDSIKSISNLYHGTKNYGMETRARSEDNVGRIMYLKNFAKLHEDVTFLFVLDDRFSKIPAESKNIFKIDYFTLKTNIHRNT